MVGKIVLHWHLVIKSKVQQKKLFHAVFEILNTLTYIAIHIWRGLKKATELIEIKSSSLMRNDEENSWRERNCISVSEEK